ncbi:hypothetical protein LEMLEM_LOCUS26002, partial [Lemmus lemmus]
PSVVPAPGCVCGVSSLRGKEQRGQGKDCSSPLGKLLQYFTQEAQGVLRLDGMTKRAFQDGWYLPLALPHPSATGAFGKALQGKCTHVREKSQGNQSTNEGQTSYVKG